MIHQTDEGFPNWDRFTWVSQRDARGGYIAGRWVGNGEIGRDVFCTRHGLQVRDIALADEAPRPWRWSYPGLREWAAASDRREQRQLAAKADGGVEELHPRWRRNASGA